MPTSSRCVKIGFIGGGMMCQVAHLPFYLGNRYCEVVAVAESRPSLVEALRHVVGQARVVNDYRSVLEDPAVDAVVISAPRPATGPLTLEALTAGKHVLAEKPMAHTFEQAERLVAAARDAGVLYSVGYMKRFDSGIERATEMLRQLRDSDRLGALLFARIFDYSRSYAVPPPPHTRPAESRKTRFETWPLWPNWLKAQHREAYSWFMNAGCHDINLLHLFMGGNLSVVAARMHVDCAIAAQLEADGVPVMLEIAKTAAGRWLEGGEFLFEKGRLAFSVPSPMDKTGVTQVRLEEEDGSEKIGKTDSGWSFARQAEGFVSALTGEAPLRNPGIEGMADMELIETIWRRIQLQ